MKPDGTDSISAADEMKVSQEGIHVSGPDSKSGPEIKEYPAAYCDTWSYIFIHNSKVKALQDRLVKDRRTFFVHRTVRYFQRTDRQKVRHQETPTISGLVFFQGRPEEIQEYLSRHFLYTYLCKDCSTGRVAVIPDSQMRPFMRVSETSPERIRFLLHPFHYYARNRILLRITTGDLAGLEGYVIRIDRDRRLVMEIGGISVAIAGVHAEKFEEVESVPSQATHADIFYQRNLHERQALIDRYFHPVKTAQEVKAQAENIAYLHDYVLSEMSSGRMNIYESWSILSFVIEEIGYYYAPFVEQQGDNLDPIMQQGGRVLQEMERIIASPRIDGDTKCRYENELQELMTKYEYLF